MSILKSIDDLYLSDLSEKIQVLPPDEAASFLFEGSALILFAGYADIAYQGFINLLKGELKISQESSLAHPLKSILPSLCYAMGIPCPEIFSEEEMSISDLEQYILQESRKYEQIANMDRWFNIVLPLDDWSDDFLDEITHPKVDIISNERFKVYRFLQDLHRIIAVRYLSRGKLQDADRLLRIFEDVVNAWKIEYKTYIEQEILVFGIRTYLGINDIVNADKYILKWWESSENLISKLYLISYLPNLMKRIINGVLQNKINISKIQSQEFLQSLNNRTYHPNQIKFIPSVENWNIFFQKEKHYNNYNFREGATEDQIFELETKLQTKLPLSYRNFLLFTNGITYFNNCCQLFGTDEIKWFMDENKDWAEIWSDNHNDISDEKYFQYGEHQDCIWIRGEYLKTALQISSTEDGYVYLLNPLIIDDRKEWEAWDFGNKLPGAYRYRSFWDMVQNIYKTNFDV